MKQLLGTLLLATLLPSAAAARTLHWRAIDVQARLDAEGLLHVSESQTMVFTGDWNGGERAFTLPSGQKLDFGGMTRVDPGSGRTLAMAEGDLAEVDRWDFVDRKTLRWRSRLPTDPEFDDTAITYVLDYTLSGVLWQDGDTFELDHDFAFADRFGEIEHFSLALEVDPVWNGGLPATLQMERSNLPPGTGAIYKRTFEHSGTEPPAATQRQVGQATRRGLVFGVFALALVQLLRWGGLESRQGRFDRKNDTASIDEGWLTEHLFSLKPEEAGAIWDQKIGAAEVAAVIARMATEGKLRSSVREEGRWFKTQILELELLENRANLQGYERTLVDKLFFRGKTKTDTEAVRKRYQSIGFNPTTLIDRPIRKAIQALPGFGKPARAPNPGLTALIFLTALGFAIAEAIARGVSSLGPILAMFFLWMLVPAALAYPFAYRYRRRADGLAGSTIAWLLPAGAMLGAPLYFVFAGHLGLGPLTLGLWGQLAVLLLPLALFNSVVNMARTRDSTGAVAMRQRLAAVRKLFRRELKSESPRLHDEWLPYLLAFGLHKDVDRWFGAHGAARHQTSHLPTRGFGGSGGRGGGGWTGGGGAFGAAGATAAWSAAATAMASGVAKPGSSGGSSGGGGSSFSGGGGGGGW